MPMRGVERLGEDALLVRLGDAIDAGTNARVHALAATLGANRQPWVRDIVPAYATLAVFIDAMAMWGVEDPLAEAEAWLDDVVQRHGIAADAAPASGSARDIPVRFGGEDGPDLAAVGEAAGLPEAEVIARFCAPVYQVAMLGFAPGFPYLLGLDPVLAMPRLATPRTRVPAGSVAIGGAQAGIYPREGPGGWRLLGRTRLGLFDHEREPPALLAPGGRVRFVPAR